MFKRIKPTVMQMLLWGTKKTRRAKGSAVVFAALFVYFNLFAGIHATSHVHRDASGISRYKTDLAYPHAKQERCFICWFSTELHPQPVYVTSHLVPRQLSTRLTPGRNDSPASFICQSVSPRSPPC